ncbi:MAG: amino acid ABC transporter substrate-binding protein [Desulfobacteraceae bacterium]|nr:amino acid ABC transporter substrate-binding protein [Desulfobacteraceae bacterium]
MKKPAMALLLIATIFTSNARTETLFLVTMDYPPHAFQKNGEQKGIYVDIALEAFKRMDQPVTIKTYPWARVIHMIKKGYADGVTGAYKTQEREQFMDYTRTPIHYGTLSLFVLKDSSIAFKGDLKELRDYRFCVVRGFSYGNTFDNAVRDRTIVHIRKAPTIEENIEAFLVLGLKTILVTEKDSCLYQLSRMNKENAVRELPVELGKIPTYIAFSKKRNRLTIIERLDRVLARMHADGTITAIIQTYTKK